MWLVSMLLKIKDKEAQQHFPVSLRETFVASPRKTNAWNSALWLYNSGP
jgi:hypothetical protein